MSDYHLHFHPHRPTPGAPPMGVYPPDIVERYVEAAATRGATEIGFTEHLYRCVESEAVLGKWWKRDGDPALVAEMDEIMKAEFNLSLERYVEVVLAAKARGLPVKLGLEVDFEPGTEQAVMDFLAGYPWDYLVGSVHWIGAWSFMRPWAPEEFERRGVRRAYEQYFSLKAELAASGMVDVLAHADVIKRHDLRPAGDLSEFYAPVVEAAARSGTAVEVTGAGLRHKVASVFPEPAFLRLFHDAGVPISLASDAHIAEDAAFGRQEVLRAAWAAGYSSYLRFDRRRPLATPLPTPAPVP